MRGERLKIPSVGRFLITGGLTTALSALTYLALVRAAIAKPGIATVLSHCLGLGIGYFLHGRWSFAGSTLNVAAAVRFVAGSLITLALNWTWTEVFTHALGLPSWTPVLPMLFITPPVSYVLNSTWVFKVRAHVRAVDPS